ncbi:MAG: hypothetical protein ACOY4R_16300 [Pseudomonadota bacterium]
MKTKKRGAVVTPSPQVDDSRSDLKRVAQASPASVGVPATVSYVYYYQDVHGRLIRTTSPPGRENVQARVLDLGGGELVEQLRVCADRAVMRTVLSSETEAGERWLRYDDPDDTECEFWRRPYRDGGAS